MGSTPRTRFQETSGSVCSAAIFSETSAPFLMRGVFSIPQKAGPFSDGPAWRSKTPGFQHQKFLGRSSPRHKWVKIDPMPFNGRQLALRQSQVMVLLPYNRTPVPMVSARRSASSWQCKTESCAAGRQRLWPGQRIRNARLPQPRPLDRLSLRWFLSRGSFPWAP